MRNNSETKHDLVAQDALTKITALLKAAQWLTGNEEEKGLMLELIGAAEDVAIRALEDCKYAG
ncbi:hypothetical protein [Pluralibacter gergoviae]|uniref:Uncharacterized protein n=1 Tax=Pluralibacter gergoviae TaxID=61647 RepID=A0AAW8HWL8_PLUGE|nr:hypothetical protein [Pluralibacter gergoviae]AVR02999.1 hypothetical protein A8H26_10010 [Pluralibacter gergoviae]KMK01581.1 hypothetical protein ABW08_22880 [Pluralibacter gergoviae]KMK28502.1 hypothetical protein ABW11_09700 [Pluralibacter gergoviae]MDQ2312439.1 hypothetical protein [Pluralibacter gergoviae]